MIVIVLDCSQNWLVFPLYLYIKGRRKYYQDKSDAYCGLALLWGRKVC